MGEFSAEWLSLREPADIAARSGELARQIAQWLERHRGDAAVDLGCGTGSNLRYLLRQLPTVQRWRLVDHDQRLLDRVPEAMRAWGASVGVDLTAGRNSIVVQPTPDVVESSEPARHVEMVAADLTGPLPWSPERVSLVTASALMDLASEAWLTRLVREVCEARAAVLVALTYDGRMDLFPRHPFDVRVRDVVNRHQRTDKGFGGAALGPDATPVMRRHFESCGYRVVTAKSDWVLTTEQSWLQRELVEGWARAVLELEPAARTDVNVWRTFRTRQLDAGHSRVVVGHDDLAAWPGALAPRPT